MNVIIDGTKGIYKNYEKVIIIGVAL